MESGVITRFAPSPTGYLHIGGARTALFNFLYARHTGGKFLLRIEDTDLKRSTKEAVDAILEGLEWLGLYWDEEPISQISRRQRHVALVKKLIEESKAYYCYCSPEELAEMRDLAKAEGKSKFYDGRWRDRDPANSPSGVKPVIRLKSPLDGETTVSDLIQGDVSVSNDEMDDMILFRADGSPTYMLAVVVDDHDMNISHVIRGDDHLTNTFRQLQIYKAFGWDHPTFAHMPLLHGLDGTKLSKRHGALGLAEYRKMGLLPEAMNNYLLRQAWAHGDDEIISLEQAIEWFDIKDVGRSPSNFDFSKLISLNSHYLREADDGHLVTLIKPILIENLHGKLDNRAFDRIKSGMSGLKERAKNIDELAKNAEFYACRRPITLSDKALKALDASGKSHLNNLQIELGSIENWSGLSLNDAIVKYAKKKDIKLGVIAQPLRAALTGNTVSPGIFEILAVLGKEQSLARINDVLT
ncbi:glutamate--tRNA ligase [Rhodospirillales bacterium]|nr:glutamate--tRNA ligase [Rhodospirillales bacterium]